MFSSGAGCMFIYDKSCWCSRILFFLIDRAGPIGLRELRDRHEEVNARGLLHIASLIHAVLCSCGMRRMGNVFMYPRKRA